jgi:HEAT repeat protein
MRLPRTLLSLTIVAALCLSSAAIAAPQAQDGAPAAESSKALYWQGHESLGRSDWRQALHQFRELEKELIASKSEPADAAIYWQAYALTQAQRPRDAGREIERLRRQFPNSVWLDDADALAASFAGMLDQGPKGDKAGKHPKDVEREADSDRLMALDALLASGNAKAVPILQRVLGGSHSDKVKVRALFVLSQIDEGAADIALQNVLSGNDSSRLKSEAIRMVAAGGSEAAFERMVAVYRGSDDPAIKRAVRDAFLIGERADLMAQLIETETDSARRRDAIQSLGAMGGGAELAKIYNRLTDPGDRRAVIDGFGIAGAREELESLAKRESEPQVRAYAIRALGLVGGEEATAALLSFYGPNEAGTVKDAVIEGLMIAGETEPLVALYRQETDAERKRQLLQMIAASGNDAALDLIDEALQH